MKARLFMTEPKTENVVLLGGPYSGKCLTVPSDFDVIEMRGNGVDRGHEYQRGKVLEDGRTAFLAIGYEVELSNVTALAYAVTWCE